MNLTISDIASFCKRRGFIFQNSEIYGGIAGFWDYGPNGVEFKENIKKEWWKTFIQSREDVVGIDSSTITHPKVWEASGHLKSFKDPMLNCTKCGESIRGDNLIEDVLKISTDGFSIKKINDLIKKNKLTCPKCKGKLNQAKLFNLMFKTYIGSLEDESSIAYLRPETAQSIFTNFKLVQETARMKLPFGIAQIGKAYRNEISPRDFLFRSREFEMMEIEYFVHPEDVNNCSYLDKKLLNYKLKVLPASRQKKNRKEKTMSMKQILNKKIIKTKWHAYWLVLQYKWFVDLGINPKNLRIRQHLDEEKSHYARDTWDIEYNYPFGWKELHGMADRTTFDLDQHIKHSKEKLEYYDEKKKKNIVPYVVAEPSQGVDRAFLAFLIDAYTQEKDRIVLKLNPKLTPIKVAVFPLVSKDKLPQKSKNIFDLLKKEFVVFYDESGSIGRRYRRMDEVGTPYCITIDYDSIKKNDVTVRERDSMKQIRVKEKNLIETLKRLLEGEKLNKFGKYIN